MDKQIENAEKKPEKPAEAPKTKAEGKTEGKGAGPKPSEKYVNKVNIADVTPAQVVKVFKKTGIYGECYQVLVRVLDGKNKGALLRRNVRGPVREADLLMLKETERDVRAA